MKAIHQRLILSTIVVGLATTCIWAGGAGRGGGGGGGGNGGGGADNYAFAYQDNWTGDLYLTTVDGSVKTKLTGSGKGTDLAPAWSPDTDRDTPGHQGWIAFFRQYDPRYIWGGIYVVPSDLSSPPVEIRSYKTFDPMPPSGESLSWTPDGQFIVYASDYDRISAVSVATGQVTLLFQDPQDPSVAGYTYDPSLSPDLDPETPGYQGYLAFSFAFDIVTAPVEVDASGKWTVEALSNLTQSSGITERHPVWSPDGATLAFYREGSNTGRALWVMDVLSGASLSVVDVYPQDLRPTWSPDGLYLGYWDAREASPGKWTTDIFYISPWDELPAINVTKTDASAASERFPDWNPAWVNNLP